MEKMIKCPCCGNQIRICFDDGNLAVFFDSQNQDEVSSILRDKCIEFAVMNGGDNYG